jgi:putative transposase
MVAQYKELTNSQWEVIKEFLPNQRKHKYSLRIIVNAIFWILRTGSQWRNLESKFPKWQIVYYYFRKWTKDGTIEYLNESLVHKAREEIGKENKLHFN